MRTWSYAAFPFSIPCPNLTGRTSQLIDVDALRTLVVPLPEVAWRRVASLCGSAIAPMYKTVQNILIEDVEHLARLMYELESLREGQDPDTEPSVSFNPRN